MAPYERPPLSKEYLRGESDHVYVRQPEWYGEHAIQTRFDTRAERVNVADSVVELEHGDWITIGETQFRFLLEGAQA